MCGWREFMEDSILAVYPLCENEDLGLFGIFDGHGGILFSDVGPECAEFAKNNFTQLLVKNENYKAKKYEEALSETFIKLD
jgi:serine/threonine protein phosphatase PrpC